MFDYIVDWPHVAAFAPYRGNQTIDPFQVYLDNLVIDNIAFGPYCSHHQTCQLDVILLCSGWLARGPGMMYVYLVELEVFRICTPSIQIMLNDSAIGLMQMKF